MKNHSGLSNMLTALGIELAVVILVMVWAAAYLPAVVLQQPEEARTRTQTMFDAISSGNYDLASAQMLGAPAFGDLPQDSSPAVGLLWEAFAASLEYRIPGKCYATNTGLALDVHIRSLDMEAVVDGVSQRAQQLLEQADSRGQNDSSDWMDGLLLEAAREALYAPTAYQERTITLSFANAEGSWWILPSEALMNLLSGLPG